VLPPASEGEYADVTYAEMRAIVRRLAAGFRELGVDDDTRVALYAQTRMEWAQTDFAVLAAGARRSRPCTPPPRRTRSAT